MWKVGLGAHIQPPHLDRKWVLLLKLLHAPFFRANTRAGAGLSKEVEEHARREARDGGKWWGLLVVVGAILRIGAETFAARGDVRRGRRKARACVRVRARLRLSCS
jgi:hypothetical protein